MSHYLDTSVVVALLLQDAHSSKADAWLIRARPILLVGDFCTIEFAAVVSRRVRMNQLTAETANLALRKFDDWLSRAVQIVQCAPEQMALASATLATFDDRLAEAARRHAVPVTIPG